MYMAKKKEPNKLSRKANAYLKYSGMAFQLAAAILIGVFVGKKLDAYLRLERPYMTAVAAMLFLLAGLYLSLKDILFKPKDED